MAVAIHKVMKMFGVTVVFLGALSFVGPPLASSVHKAVSTLIYRLFWQPNSPQNCCLSGNLWRLYDLHYRKHSSAISGRHVHAGDASHERALVNDSLSSHVWASHEARLPGPLADSLHRLIPLLRQNEEATVALGSGITTRTYWPILSGPLSQSLTFFQQLLPSFLMTASVGYHYIFYIAYDYNDPVLKDEAGRSEFSDTFRSIVQSGLCQLIHVDLVFVRCGHTGKPAWAQNDAMMAAYQDNITYFYMVNDDTVMLTPDWTQAFIDTLQTMTPPYLGVVGPTHTGGNINILTYHFLHRTHFDVFHFFYPRNFTGWYADDWITNVYKPDHSYKLESIRLSHTEHPTRYNVHVHSADINKRILNETYPILQSYMKARSR